MEATEEHIKKDISSSERISILSHRGLKNKDQKRKEEIFRLEISQVRSLMWFLFYIWFTEQIFTILSFRPFKEIYEIIFEWNPSRLKSTFYFWVSEEDWPTGNV